MLKDLVKQNRSFRRFKPEPVAEQILIDLIDHARFTGCAKNMQTIRYQICSDPARNDEIFKTLAWAGFLKDWPGPVPDERPTAYIVMTHDTQLPNRWIEYDLGIAAQTILLAAAEKDMGGCIVAAIRKNRLKEICALGERYEIKLVLALGIPKEKIVIDSLQPGGDSRYWREPDMTHHVPKHSLEELLLPQPKSGN